MFWARRRFGGADAAPYEDKLGLLQRVFAAQHEKFIMVSKDTDIPGVADYYIGVPLADLLAAFDDFERVTEDQLPREIDVLLVADQTKEPFTSKFQIRKR